MAMHTIKKGIKFKKKKRYRRFHVVFITDGDALGYASECMVKIDNWGEGIYNKKACQKAE